MFEIGFLIGPHHRFQLSFQLCLRFQCCFLFVLPKSVSNSASLIQFPIRFLTQFPVSSSTSKSLLNVVPNSVLAVTPTLNGHTTRLMVFPFSFDVTAWFMHIGITRIVKPPLSASLFPHHVLPTKSVFPFVSQPHKLTGHAFTSSFVDSQVASVFQTRQC